METINYNGRTVPMPAWKEGVEYPPLDTDFDVYEVPSFDEDSGRWAKYLYAMGHDAEYGWGIMEGDCDGNWDYFCTLGEWEDPDLYGDMRRNAWREYYEYCAETGTDPLNEFFSAPARILRRERWTALLAPSILGLRVFTLFRGWGVRRPGRPEDAPEHVRSFLGLRRNNVITEPETYREAQMPPVASIEELRANLGKGDTLRRSRKTHGYVLRFHAEYYAPEKGMGAAEIRRRAQSALSAMDREYMRENRHDFNT